ncbi:MAG: cytochrome c biogenesis protein ResB [Micrococcales bacterium]|nr:cytochrome c biogenesis protein ResB [Micrococcales bacterium]
MLDHRPDDYADGVAAAPRNPRLGPVGWARFAWRQLTSMRTALALLLLLGIASVPGSLVPQRTSDPNGVVMYQQRNPELFKTLDALGAFNAYSSFWFSAIYLLLFISLIGCIIPRTTHHLRSLRSAPPTTPARLSRLPSHRVEHSAAGPEEALTTAHTLLRRSGYRVVRYDQGDRITLSAERGYLRETGNLVFHLALIGILVSIAIGSGFIYSGQKIVLQGSSFTNSTINYDSFNPGRFYVDGQLDPYSFRLDSFEPRYSIEPRTGRVTPQEYTARVTIREQGAAARKGIIKVNEPLDAGGTQIYLLGNGYAPSVSILDPAGKVIDTSTTPFLAQDGALTSLGVVKVPDGLSKQLGLRGFFYPQPVQTAQGIASIYPDAGRNTLLSLEVWQGDLGLNKGVAVNAYSLDTTKMTKLAGRNAPVKALQLTRGQTVKLPNGLGSVRFDGWKRFIGIEIRHDPTKVPMAVLVSLAVLGLLVSLFVPRRRVWVAATKDGSGARLEYAALARGDDPRLSDALASLAWQHLDRLGERPSWTVGPDRDAGGSGARGWSSS